MKLYKIIQIRKDFFIKPKLRLTQRLALNDPFECLPPAEQVANLYQRIFSEFKKNGRDIGSFERIGDYINSSESEQLYQYTNLNDGYGIVSLCQELHSIVMWSHYGNMHKGIAIEIDTKKISLKNSLQHSEFKHSPKSAPQPVIYSKSRQLNDPGGYTFNHLFDSFFLKSDEWSYEKEFRIVSELSNADEVLIDKSVWLKFTKEYEDYIKFFDIKNRLNDKLLVEVNENAYNKDVNMTFGDNPDKMRRNLLSNAYQYWAKHKTSIFLSYLPFEAITKVYFGCDISVMDKREIMSEIDTHKNKPQIIQLKRHKNRFELII